MSTDSDDDKRHCKEIGAAEYFRYDCVTVLRNVNFGDRDFAGPTIVKKCSLFQDHSDFNRTKDLKRRIQ